MQFSLLALSCVFGVVICQQQPGYLPPTQNKGYNYNPPSVPFPNNVNPTKVPYPPAVRPPPPPQPRPPQPPQGDHQHHDDHHHEPGMPFDFSYQVNEIDYGNDYSHKANSDGDITRGEYRVQLPDGRLQIVKYTADWKNGFNAEVSYEGEAKYPDQPAGQPSSNNNNYGSAPSGGYKY